MYVCARVCVYHVYTHAYMQTWTSAVTNQKICSIRARTCRHTHMHKDTHPITRTHIPILFASHASVSSFKTRKIENTKKNIQTTKMPSTGGAPLYHIPILLASRASVSSSSSDSLGLSSAVALAGVRTRTGASFHTYGVATISRLIKL